MTRHGMQRRGAMLLAPFKTRATRGGTDGAYTLPWPVSADGTVHQTVDKRLRLFELLHWSTVLGDEGTKAVLGSTLKFIDHDPVLEDLESRHASNPT